MKLLKSRIAGLLTVNRAVRGILSKHWWWLSTVPFSRLGAATKHFHCLLHPVSPNFFIDVCLTCIWQNYGRHWGWVMSVSTWEELGRAEAKGWRPRWTLWHRRRSSCLAVCTDFRGFGLTHASGCAPHVGWQAWLRSGKLQTCEHEAHCEIKVAY